MQRGLFVIIAFILLGGQESMVNERSTHHFYMLDLHHKEQGWQVMPGWDGPSLSYAVGVAQRGRFYLFSGRSYAPDELMTEYTEGYVFEPGTGKWNKMTGSFPGDGGYGHTLWRRQDFDTGRSGGNFADISPSTRDLAVNFGWSVRT